MKTCSRCGGMSTMPSWCLACRSAYGKQYYSRHKSVIVPKANICFRRRRAEREALVRELKTAPCTDCGGFFPPYVMDFDHLDPSTKVSCVSRLVLAAVPVKRLLDELAKCELVCSNCHRVRSHRRHLIIRKKAEVQIAKEELNNAKLRLAELRKVRKLAKFVLKS